MSELMHVNVIVMLSQQVSLVSSLISIHVNGTFIKAGWYNRERRKLLICYCMVLL